MVAMCRPWGTTWWSWDTTWWQWDTTWSDWLTMCRPWHSTCGDTWLWPCDGDYVIQWWPCNCCYTSKCSSSYQSQKPSLCKICTTKTALEGLFFRLETWPRCLWEPETQTVQMRQRPNQRWSPIGRFFKNHCQTRKYFKFFALKWLYWPNHVSVWPGKPLKMTIWISWLQCHSGLQNWRWSPIGRFFKNWPQLPMGPETLTLQNWTH